MSSVEASRLQHWGIVTACSVISLISICTATKNQSRDHIEKFAIAVASISFIIGTLFMTNAKWSDYTGKPNLLNGTFVELLASGFNFIMWCFAIGFLTSRNTAYYGGSGIRNANVYYFTWGTFIAVIMTLFEVTKHIFNPSDFKHSRVGTWSLLTTASIIVMVSSVDAYVATDCNLFRGKSAFCARSVFGISLGCISAFLGGLTMLGFLFGPEDSNGILQIEAILSFLFTISWAFGVAYITGANGPGIMIGNLYYFTWISFFSALVIFLDCLSHIKPEASEVVSGKKSRAQDVDDDGHA